jgi:hypothetical protein
MKNNITNVFNKVFFIEEYKVIVYLLYVVYYCHFYVCITYPFSFSLKEEEKMSSYECGFNHLKIRVIGWC